MSVFDPLHVLMQITVGGVLVLGAYLIIHTSLEAYRDHQARRRILAEIHRGGAGSAPALWHRLAARGQLTPIPRVVFALETMVDRRELERWEVQGWGGIPTPLYSLPGEEPRMGLPVKAAPRGGARV